ncbi:PTH2 domain containing protein [Amanita muscaria]
MALLSSSLTTHVGISVVLCATSLWLGYQLGSRIKEPEVLAVTETSVQDEDTEDEDGIADGDLAAVKAGILEPCKLVLVVRTDLGMTPGKVAAQCGHATLACYKALTKKNLKLVQHWERTGQAKIALKANSEEQLMELEAIAKSLNICARSIRDAGHTQVESGTRTVLAIGPAPVELVNQVTGKLRLF